jgi:hypothetical protein
VNSRVIVLAFALGLGVSVPVQAHTSLPAYLELQEKAPGTFDMLWRLPTAEGPPPAIYPIFPSSCVVPPQLSTEQGPGSIVQRGTIRCGSQGLKGAKLEIEGLPLTILDAFVKINFAGGQTVTQILRPLTPSFVVLADGKTKIDALGYVELGIGHILYGIDHLLFVLGLLLIVEGARTLFKTITAFTVAHTITLGLATFGVVHVAPTPVEAVIALSIVFLAAEIAQAHRGVIGLTYQKPWLVAFAFGLLHGFGFAGTLAQIGLPTHDIPMALLFFNVGVETGQIIFVVAFLAFVHSLRELEIQLPAWSYEIPSYAIGSLASFWFLQRLLLSFAF